MSKILVIDDEPLICEMLDDLLSLAGHVVVVAGNGREAMELFESQAFEIVIADIVMPEMDGIETIMKLKENDPSVSVIAISGGSRLGNYDFLGVAEKLGASRVFYKPVDNEALLAAIDRISKSQNTPLSA